MEKGQTKASPDAYVANLEGWRRDQVEALRAVIRPVDGLSEVIKWGHLVYLSNGPTLLIRAEGQRVVLGFWRGQQLRKLEPRLKPVGQFEMATISLADGETVAPETVAGLCRAAIALNAELGDPMTTLKKGAAR